MRSRRYFTVWKSFLDIIKQERAANVIQNFARVVVAKRKVRVERIIAMALGKSSAVMVRLCFKNWDRWRLDNKLEKCAATIQRRYRGLIGRRRFLRQRDAQNKHEKYERESERARRELAARYRRTSFFCTRRASKASAKES